MAVRPIVLFGPSGSGKSTLLKKLLASLHGPSFGFSVSHTTRSPRTGEVDGKDYHFSAREAMAKDIADGKFIEVSLTSPPFIPQNAEFSGNMYGTSFKAVQDVLDAGKNVILDIDVQGVKQLKAGPEKLASPLYIFICPPNLQELERRLRSRGTETEDSLSKRLAAAKGEWEWGNTPGNADAIVVNDDLETAYVDLIKALGLSQ
ncbi:MAG: hypothetical protein SGCHY_000956 [Lobulomycetales sp.]